MDDADAIRVAADKARLRDEIETLKNDLSTLRATLAEKGIQFMEDLSSDEDDGDLSALAELKERGAEAARYIGRRARWVAHTPTQNSISTLMIIAGLGVVIGLLAR